MHNKVKVGITDSRRGINKPLEQKQPLFSLLDCIAFVGLSCRCLWTLFSSRLPNALGYAYLSVTCDWPSVLERTRIRLSICDLPCTFRSRTPWSTLTYLRLAIDLPFLHALGYACRSATWRCAFHSWTPYIGYACLSATCGESMPTWVVKTGIRNPTTCIEVRRL